MATGQPGWRSYCMLGAPSEFRPSGCIRVAHQVHGALRVLLLPGQERAARPQHIRATSRQLHADRIECERCAGAHALYEQGRGN